VLTFVKLHVLCLHRGYKKSSACVISGTVLSISVDIGVRSIIVGLKIHTFSEIAYHST
jgi:hypothetical protein